MAAVLVRHAYGKSLVRLTKVTHQADRHELQEVSIDVRLEGDFAGTYLDGDNSRIIATDSMKNTVYVLAKRHPFADLESFGQALAEHFLTAYAQIAVATIGLTERPWRRIEVDGRAHPHAFIGGESEKRTCLVTFSRQERRVEAGIDELLILKTTDSAFRGFIRDPYTTLPEADERIFATMLTGQWLYRTAHADWADWNGCHALIRRTLLETFAGHKSLSVQQTLFAMGEAALAACGAIEEITLTMPNQHRLLVNLRPFGLENDNEIFVPTEEPYGLIAGTVRRG